MVVDLARVIIIHLCYTMETSTLSSPEFPEFGEVKIWSRLIVLIL